jgi:hypothetical protein
MSPNTAARPPLDARSLVRLACAYALATNGTILMPFAFFASQWLITLAFHALTPFISARLSSLDADGSLVARSVVVCFASVAVGTAAAGGLLTSLGPLGLGVLLAFCAAAGMPFARFAFAPTHHHQEPR